MPPPTTEQLTKAAEAALNTLGVDDPSEAERFVAMFQACTSLLFMPQAAGALGAYVQTAPLPEELQDQLKPYLLAALR